MAKSVRVVVGQRIRELREKKGWSQEKLAEEADLHRTYIGQVERGEKNIGVENLVRIAAALGSTAADVLRGI
ncbi:MAG: helix-turn-helix transcriptional regulator [bacterium]